MKGYSVPINWEVYDLSDKFSVFEAACLWLEIEPTKEIERNTPGTVRKMIEAIQERAGGFHTTVAVHRAPTSYRPGVEYGPKPVSRDSLIKMAEAIGQKPKLLFPESRKAKDSLSPKERKTALKLIIGMAMSKYQYDPQTTRSGVPTKIVNDLYLKGIEIDIDTVRNWLQEAASQLDDFIK